MSQSVNFIGDAAAARDDAVDHAQASETSTESSTPIASAPKTPANRASVGLLLLAVLGGGAWYYFHGRTGPQSASAATVAAADAATANRTIGQFLNGGSTNLKSMETMLHNTEKVVQQFNNYPSIRQVPLSALQTNPFRQSTTVNQEDAEAKQKLDEQRQAAQKAFESLQLQLIVHGKNSSCLINNALYREGQQVNGFVVEKINPASVSIKQGNWEFELKMQK